MHGINERKRDFMFELFIWTAVAMMSVLAGLIGIVSSVLGLGMFIVLRCQWL